MLRHFSLIAVALCVFATSAIPVPDPLSDLPQRDPTTGRRVGSASSANNVPSRTNSTVNGISKFQRFLLQAHLLTQISLPTQIAQPLLVMKARKPRATEALPRGARHPLQNEPKVISKVMICSSLRVIINYIPDVIARRGELFAAAA